MSSLDKKMLKAAAEAALQNSETCMDIRSFFLGSVGLRNDGVIVSSRNVAARDVALTHHAEARLSRKLTPQSEVWVARVRKNGEWAMSRPCKSCQIKLKKAGVDRVVYTLGPNEWGTLEFKDA